MKNLKPRLELVFDESDKQPPESELPPLTPYLIQCWRRYRHTFPPDHDISSPDGRQKFVYWYVVDLLGSRYPYEPPLPAALVQWLNHPRIDVTAETGYRPSIRGLIRDTTPKGMSRLMVYLWNRYHNRTSNIFSATGYYEFITWFALNLSTSLKLPRVVVPDEVVTLLNAPADLESLPLTVGMFVNATMQWPERFAGLASLPRSVLLARSFEALGAVLKTEDFRLVPDYVSQFWSSRPFSDRPLITRYEYVAARSMAAPVLGDVPIGDLGHQMMIRRWFHENYLSKLPQARVFSGAPLRLSADTEFTVSEEASPEQAIIVYRDHKTIAGLNRAGATAIAAAKALGMPVQDIEFDLPRTRIREEFAKNASIRPPRWRALHIFAMNPEYVPECIHINRDRWHENDYSIGCFYWELSEISAVHELGVSLMDEIWVASDYLVDVYRKYTDRPVINMKQAVVAPPLKRRYSKSYFCLPEDHFIFLFSFDAGSVVNRKNPLGAVNAFRQAFPSGSEPVMLILKTRNTPAVNCGIEGMHWGEVLQAAQADWRIRIIDQTMTDEELFGLKSVIDCYVSLHRAEGFGYGPAEAMLLGKPVITTAYSGTRDFCNPQTALLVDFQETVVPFGTYPYMDRDRTYKWSEPSVEDAASKMRLIVDDPSLRERLGKAGRKIIQSEYSLDALTRRYQKRIAELGIFSEARQVAL